MASKKIPCGGFGYDDNDFEFITPMGGGIPTLKSKGGAVPEEVSNAVETHGMGWTDEDEVVHQIDEKYIPSSGGAVDTIEVSAELSDDGIVATLVTPEDSIVENIDNIKFAKVSGILYNDYLTCQRKISSDGVVQIEFSGIIVNTQPDSVSAVKLTVVIIPEDETICDICIITIYDEESSVE